MKRFSVLVIIFSVVLSSVGLWQVMAQNAPMTEAHIERIRTHCVDAQSTLTQLHSSDALLRVNRGRLYESIATKLMIPFNSRLTSNQLDGKSLIDAYGTYEGRLAEFRTNYQSYEQAMSEALRINCTNQPVSFYDKIGETRAKRQKVHENVAALHNSINSYRAAFDVFEAKFEEEK